ncbi:hypothetical protein [Gaetbulibacter jejuensis]|uniref:hypothetical protein n=1 Tax=Gaetbulibacter jejuensis TaxID=584607 RepID=UPI00300821D8
MITNTNLKNRLKDDGKGLSEQDLNTLRNFFVKMANIEYEYHKNKSLENDCRHNKILDISNGDNGILEQIKKAA